MLDIQPGRSTFSAETAALAGWLAQPDVDLALDPEWNVGPRGVPGQTPGKVGAAEVNAVIAGARRRSCARTICRRSCSSSTSSGAG